LGFQYTYACLISSETDFFTANEKRLLPRKADDATIEWEDWKTLARAIQAHHNDKKVHPCFLRPELRLGRINSIHRFTRWPPGKHHRRRPQQSVAVPIQPQTQQVAAPRNNNPGAAVGGGVQLQNLQAAALPNNNADPPPAAYAGSMV